MIAFRQIRKPRNSPALQLCFDITLLKVLRGVVTRALIMLLSAGDFCQWQDYTAADTFGRFETEYAVTASNLFKYCQPCHGLVLFKHHDPLHFEGSKEQPFMELNASDILM